MDPTGFLPAHLQTKKQGTSSGPHVIHGSGQEGATSQGTSGLERNTGLQDDSRHAQGSGFDGHGAGGYTAANDPVSRNVDSGRGAEDTAALTAAGTAAGTATRREEEPRVKDHARHDAGGHSGARSGDATTRREAAEQRELDAGRGMQDSSSFTPADNLTGSQSGGREPYVQQDPSRRTREEEALGAGAVAGAGAGALAAHRGRDDDPYARQGLSGQDSRGLDANPNVGGRARGEDALDTGVASGVGDGTVASGTRGARDEDSYAGQGLSGPGTHGLGNSATLGDRAGDEGLDAGTSSGIGAAAGALGGQSLRDQAADPQEGSFDNRDAPQTGSYAQGEGVGSRGTQEGSSYPQESGLTDSGAIGDGSRSYGSGNAPQIGGDPDSGFTAGRDAGLSAGTTGQQQDPSLSSTAGQTSGPQTGTGSGAQTSLTSEIGGVAKEGLFHGHHTTLTGERLDPHIGGSGA